MKKLLLVSALAYLLFTLARTPASMLISHLESQIQPARLVNVSGTLWKGEADLSVQIQPYGRYQWSISALPLLAGQLSVTINKRNSDSSVLISKPVWAASHLSAVDMKIKISDLSTINPLLSGIQSSLQGLITDINMTGCEEVAGELILTPLVFSGIDFGRFVGTPKCVGKNYQVDFSNSGSDLKVTGFVTFSLNGQYRVNGKIRTNNSQYINQLSPLLGASRNGEFQINYAGRL